MILVIVKPRTCNSNLFTESEETTVTNFRTLLKNNLIIEKCGHYRLELDRNIRNGTVPSNSSAQIILTDMNVQKTWSCKWLCISFNHTIIQSCSSHFWNLQNTNLLFMLFNALPSSTLTMNIWIKDEIHTYVRPGSTHVIT